MRHPDISVKVLLACLHVSRLCQARRRPAADEASANRQNTSPGCFIICGGAETPASMCESVKTPPQPETNRHLP